MSQPAPELLRSTAIEAVVLAQWPGLAERLGERREPFLAAAWRQALHHGIDDIDAAARYVNLCCAFGPAFETRHENEWAHALLADDRLNPFVRLHQLVLRAARELQQRGSDASALGRADATLLDLLDAQRRRNGLAGLPRRACDVEALEFQLLDTAWRTEYRKSDGGWKTAPVEPPAALRIDREHPAPEFVSMLSHAPGRGPAARLRLRQFPHGGCGSERHPAVRWVDDTGLTVWRGADAQAPSWSVRALEQQPSNRLGAALAEQTSPAVHIVEALSCAVRDDGVPVGPLRTQVRTWPADQWFVAWQREAACEWRWPAGAVPSPCAHSTFRLERDGVAVDASPWQGLFDEQLARALELGLGRVFDAWSSGARSPTMHAAVSMLSGRSAMTWGWRESAGGLATPPFMRILAELDVCCAIDIAVEGEVETGAVRHQVRLLARGMSRLQWSLERESDELPLSDAFRPAILRLRCPFEMEQDPIANAEGVTWAESGAITGALNVEAGLRPRSAGSGWQWFAKASLEPVLASVTIHDPALGDTHRTIALLPAVAVLDWSAG